MLSKTIVTSAVVLFSATATSTFANQGFVEAGEAPAPVIDSSAASGFLTEETASGKVFGRGTGSWICTETDDRALLLTALHVVRGLGCEHSCAMSWNPAPQYKVRSDFSLEDYTLQTTPMTLRIVAEDAHADLVLLETQGDAHQGTCLPQNQLQPHREFTPAIIIGFPYLVHRPAPNEFSNQVFKRASFGSINQLRHGRFPLSIVTDADALPGNSGSLVFSQDGAVVGMVHLIYTPDSIPTPGPQGFEIIQYGGFTLFTPSAKILKLLQTIAPGEARPSNQM